MITFVLAASLFQSAPTSLTFAVDGVERKAEVYRAANAGKTVPIVFVFHGFTGNAKQAAASYRMHTAWPEATVVYPQGLEVELLGTKAPGWQIAPKLNGDRDLKFYDAMLAKLKSDHQADSSRIFTCGMSNGAIFSYVLITERANTLAAAAPVAGFAMPAFRGAPATPILIVHGKKDTLITLKAAERSRDLAIENNGAGKVEKEWQPGFTSYTPVKNNHDVIWHTHEGGHTWPADTSDSIAKFFKEHSRKN